ncbi:lysine--tRNA ligase [Candidatus Gracilibacteria bacterium]|nr:lysine--tRNA ligase [Candidatus Gracilibacteria bacterium]
MNMGEIAKERKLILRDEKTLSGRPHVGSLRSFTMHAVLSDVLTSRGVDHEYFYEINDTDALEKIPAYVPEEWKEHLGKPLRNVPAPDGKSENYAMQFADEYTNILKDAKYPVTFYVSSEKYLAGDYDKYIRLALDHKDDIRAIYKDVSGGEKPESWYPCQVICDECGKIASTSILSWDGEEVEYACDVQKDWRKGCGHKGKKSPFGGEATLPWKVEWAAKFCILEVDLEGAGKDHYAAGGSRHIANRICEEIFDRKHPFDVRHEFILVEGGKMSSSTGLGLSAMDLYELLPRDIFRFMMVQKDVMRTINFSPDGDTIPVLFDQYDGVCKNYFAEEKEGVKEHKNRFFELTHFYEGKDLSHLDRFLPRFSQIAFYAQMPHVDLYEKMTELKGSALTEADKKEIDTRVKYAKHWLETCGPEKYIFKIQDEVPDVDLDAGQREFLGSLAKFLGENSEANGEAIQGFIHEKKNEMGLEPKKIFQAIYMAILAKDSGPKAGWLLEALDNKFLLERFNAIANG